MADTLTVKLGASCSALAREAFALAIISEASFGSPLKIATRAASISWIAWLPSCE